MLFDLTTLQVIWWALIGVVLILYATTSGFDFGVTLLLPFMNRKVKFIDNDNERRVLINTVAPTWDGNQVWLIFAGGALLVIWPVVYSSIFSGLYIALMCVLWSFFLRPPGFDYRSKLPSPIWRKMWDIGLFISAFIPVIVFGLLIGNLFVGLPIFFDPITLRSFYMGNLSDLFNMFGINVAFATMCMFLMHGAAHLNRRTGHELNPMFKRAQQLFGFLFLVFFSLGWLLLYVHVKGYVLVHSPDQALLHPLSNVVIRKTGMWIHNLVSHPSHLVAPIMVYVFTIVSMLSANNKGRKGFSFWCSALAIASTVITFGVTLFPFIVPSSVLPGQSLTVWNSTSSQYTLMGMLYLTVPMLLIVFAYKIWSYTILWRKKSYLETKDVVRQSNVLY
ncbi:MAG: cytochrome d ubiquinol oxidase subunit II [Thiotrichales bacterium]|nr:MAG: cytochrome d ubiquinol oxidase subunit II [Thiotrichales bacterium]